jgi:hypothetical protein
MKKLLFISLVLLSISSCELLEDATENTQNIDIAEGLKEALRVGTDTATSKLAVVDGYLKDQAVKILLPDELEKQIQDFKNIQINVPLVGTVTGDQIYNAGLPTLGINSLASKEDELILGINRAAEEAAKEAGPIFFEAIRGITITDAENILYGSDSAATTFLIDRTYSSLFNTFEPKVDAAVNSVEIGNNGKTVEDVYADFVQEYNDILNTTVGFGTISSLSGLNTISQPDISAFATEKGLDGLFLKVQEEEKNIREDPFARVTQILEDVFSLLDQ